MHVKLGAEAERGRTSSNPWRRTLDCCLESRQKCITQSCSRCGDAEQAINHLVSFTGGLILRLDSVQVALDFIGKRGSTVGVAKSARVQYAREILQRELLPHLGIGEYCETKKVSVSH